LPASVTAESGIDALCQAIEAYWSVKHNSTSDKYAISSIKSILQSLEDSVLKSTKKSRDKMALGSLSGGLAFSNTQTTICHSLSYPMTVNWKIVHGQATSITLPVFIEKIFPLLGKRKLSILKAMNVKNEKQAAIKIKKLIKSIGLKIKLSELKIKKN